ncbi:DUF2584 domain-containing protein [Candidatus Dojkabacteria bacterium]|uniref:DUF2584 domain-containing protein n=1 Tax=Candidatus Dojkabacteria bacterium TaxID=2099670 RepID=A0A955L5B0_9BACT|nr:DUF2584 domain-containing protein [Candidatus Dojkabacteria bacterium]
MGFQIKFNWVLQINAPSILEVRETYEFSKEGNRAFPLNAPIDLIDMDRNCLAKIKILEFTNEEGRTSGSFIVVKVYQGEEKKILTNYWLENQ